MEASPSSSRSGWVTLGALQLFADLGVGQRMTAAGVVGLILAAIVVILDFAYYRVLEGWSFTGIVFNLGTIVILTLKRNEFA